MKGLSTEKVNQLEVAVFSSFYFQFAYYNIKVGQNNQYFFFKKSNVVSFNSNLLAKSDKPIVQAVQILKLPVWLERKRLERKNMHG